MEAVDADYTRISLETAERVGRQLDAGLAEVGLNALFRLQGSVPLNVHIRGVSDVDLLNISSEYLTYDKSGARSVNCHYTSPTSRTSFEVLSELRASTEKILKRKFPAAVVDCTGGKAIKLSGGSLQRPVDVVPSHWYDSAAYQASGSEVERGVVILDKNKSSTIENYPFTHIALVTRRDEGASGGLKKAIRLCKNVKSDAEDDGTQIDFPSFDIAATMYHANIVALGANTYYELSVLAECQRFLDYLTLNESEARKLVVPDGTRRVFDSDRKLAGLRKLSLEFDDLAREVAKEQNPLVGSNPSLSASRQAIEKAFVF
jgi:hypothetical protein